MRGKFPLNIVSIDNTVPTTPGAYVLVNTSNNAVYVGRSDTDLDGRLKNHLPEREDNAWIRRSFSTDFYYEPTTVIWRVWVGANPPDDCRAIWL
ncbi:MAG: GIY-YIG nuclease family protein [Candidatus Omnitrophica bacterium]|nr:GIY-YIG nuclease family protein [Candidatus Omnitrophota bacterium]MBU4457140.1 GIY-YIG nuclease family protein [Candidatus Omnitrophota bacterium]